MPRAQACDIIIDMKPTFGHCGLVTGNWRNPNVTAGLPTGQEVVEATNAGIVEGSWTSGRAFCFRANTLNRTDAEAVQRVALEIKGAAQYGATRAVFKSWSGTSSFGTGALGRLRKYQTRTGTHQGVPKNVYCSELVVLAYQLGLAVDQQHAAWIALDGNHTLPSTLTTWLTRNATRWTCVGVITGPDLELTAI